MKLYIYPYKAGSKSVAALKEALGAKIIRLENSRFKGKGKVVINWGNSMTNEEIEAAAVLNEPDKVANATNKRTFFETVVGHVSIPDFTTEKEEAESWLPSPVVVRERLQGHSAEGVVILEDVDDFANYNHNRAKLYVRYIPKRTEYRVHVVNGEVIDVQQKAIRHNRSSTTVNFRIQNHANGFIYKREDVNPPNMVLEEAVKAVTLCGLHFGAVDVIWNEFRKTAYVLEVNTAPGLEGQTVEKYTVAFDLMRQILEEQMYRSP